MRLIVKMINQSDERSFNSIAYLHPSDFCQFENSLESYAQIQLNNTNYYIKLFENEKVDQGTISFPFNFINNCPYIFTNIGIDVEPIVDYTQFRKISKIIFEFDNIKFYGDGKFQIDTDNIEKMIFKDKNNIVLHKNQPYSFTNNMFTYEVFFKVKYIETNKYFCDEGFVPIEDWDETMKFKDGKMPSVNRNKDVEFGIINHDVEIETIWEYYECVENVYISGSSYNSQINLNEINLNTLGVGGLESQMNTLLSKLFSSRNVDKEILQEYNFQHVKGVILYGPPGCGKTLLIRKLAKLIRAREPKIINGPELINKYVGQSEENLREIFKEAEKEQNEKGANSSLHIIVFDECDSLFSHRSGGSNTLSQLGNNMVNQLLSKMDGINQLNNIIIFGLTNRLESIDSALLRPGRFDLKICVGLPNAQGRKEIFNIHLKNTLEENKRFLSEIVTKTRNFTGAEIAGIVRESLSVFFFEESENLKKQLTGAQKLQLKNILRETIESFNPQFGSKSYIIQDLDYSFSQHIYDELDFKIEEINRYNNSLYSVLIYENDLHKMKEIYSYLTKGVNDITCIHHACPQNFNSTNTRENDETILSFIDNYYSEDNEVQVVILEQLDYLCLDYNSLSVLRKLCSIEPGSNVKRIVIALAEYEISNIQFTDILDFRNTNNSSNNNSNNNSKKKRKKNKISNL